MQNELPKYLFNKRNTSIFILGTAIFSLLFIFVFSPFESRTWVTNDWQFIGWSASVVFAAVLILSLSRFLMYMYVQHKELTYISYGVWIISEIACMSLVYDLVVVLGFPDFAMEHHLEFFSLMREIIIGTSFMLLIPYTIIFLWLELQDKRQQLAHLTQLSEPLQPQADRLNFYDEKGDLKLSAKPEVVYYIEAADNYVVIHYSNGQKMEKLMLRNTLKNIELRFHEHNLVRCHRSYLVNLTKVQMLRRVEGEVMLDFGDENVAALPVGKSYYENVTKCFSSPSLAQSLSNV